MSEVYAFDLGWNLLELDFTSQALEVANFSFNERNTRMFELSLLFGLKLAVFIIFEEFDEQVCFMRFEFEFYLSFCRLKGLTDRYFIEYLLVKLLREVDCGLVEHFAFLLNAYDMA